MPTHEKQGDEWQVSYPGNSGFTETCKKGPLDIHSVKVRCFPCPHEPQFVMLKGLSLPNAVRGKARMSSSSSVPLSTFLLGIFSRSKLRQASADEETPQISTWTKSRQEHVCLLSRNDSWLPRAAGRERWGETDRRKVKPGSATEPPYNLGSAA